MRKFVRYLITLLVVFALGTSASAAGQLDVMSLIKKANLAAYYAGKDGRAKVRLTIVDKSGNKRIRQFVMLRRNRTAGGDQDYFVLFTRPADVRKTTFLVAKHTKRDDDRWLYLPALDLVKRISAGDKRTSFVGSHFFYEDISGRSIHADRHQLVKSTATHHVIKSVPKQPGSVEFRSYTVWIDRKTSLPSKMEYLDQAGRRYRRIEAVTVETIGGFPTVTKMKVSDLRSGGYTISEMRGVTYNIGVPQGVFSEQSLRRAPKQWLRK